VIDKRTMLRYYALKLIARFRYRSTSKFFEKCRSRGHKIVSAKTFMSFPEDFRLIDAYRDFVCVDFIE
jgi:hypothetical protein